MFVCFTFVLSVNKLDLFQETCSGGRMAIDETTYTITNILRLSIYTSMNHSLLFNPQALALQNISRHPF